MRPHLLALVVLLAAACGGPAPEAPKPPPTEVSLAYTITADGVLCAGALLSFDFRAYDASGTLTDYRECEWSCAAYQGTAAQQVTLVFQQTASGWQLTEASLNPLAPDGTPIGCP